jgi:hypothetical protein
MLDPACGKLMAGGKARLASPDHHGLDLLRHRHSQGPTTSLHVRLSPPTSRRTKYTTVVAVWMNPFGLRARSFRGRGATIRSIAVLPLQNLWGDARQEHFVAGVHEALITDLPRIGLAHASIQSRAKALASVAVNIVHL